MRIRFLDSRLGLRNSTTRLPFRYGSACLTCCPQAVLEVTIEAGGATQVGFAADCLPPSWFDKSPDKGFAQQIDEMLAVIALAQACFREQLQRPLEFFPVWLTAQRQVHDQARQRNWPGLLASFGVSMLERAVIDAMCRAARLSFASLLRENLLCLRPGQVHPELDGLEPKDWLPKQPLTSVNVRHTVGLSDPLTGSDVAADERLNDGYPQALEEYVQQTGTKFLKIKVSNSLEHDIARLESIAALMRRLRGDDYRVTLDGNEQYKQPEDFDRLIEAIARNERLRTLWRNTLLIEQPLPRDIALNEIHTAGIRQLSARKTVIIDESDETLDAYRRAIDLGYRGISSKNCKGPVRSVLNAGLSWWHNAKSEGPRYTVTGEDLCTVGIIPVQADLCLAVSLGISHVERNGHHYHHGISYLPRQQQRAAVEAHRDFYRDYGDVIRPHVQDGRFEIGSLQCTGFGFSVLPNLDEWISPEDWQFESLF